MSEKDANKDIVFRSLRRNPRGMTVAELEDETRLQGRSIRNYLAELVDEGKAQRDGKYYLADLPYEKLQLRPIALSPEEAIIEIDRRLEALRPETQAVLDYCQAHDWPAAVCDVWSSGGEGGRALGQAIIEALERPARFQPNYNADMDILTKLNRVATRVYGADGVDLTAEAQTQLKWLEAHDLGHLRVCIAKTQYSFSDDPKGGGSPTGFRIQIRSLQPSAGAGFVVALAGDVMTMPGLPDVPAAEGIDVDEHGRISGLF